MRSHRRKLFSVFLFLVLALAPLASAVGKTRAASRPGGKLPNGEEFSLLPGAGPLMKKALSIYFSGGLGRSLRAFKRAADAEEDYRSRFYLALVQFRLGRYPEALSNFNRAKALKPSPSYQGPIRIGLRLTREQLSLRKARKRSRSPKGVPSSRRAPAKAKEAKKVSPAKAPAKDGAELLSRRLHRLTAQLFRLGSRLKTLRFRAREHEKAMKSEFFRGRYEKLKIEGMDEKAFESFLQGERREMALWLLGLLEKRMRKREQDYNAYYPTFKAELERREQRGKRLVEEGERLLSTPEGDTQENRRLQVYNQEELEKVREQLRKLESYRSDYRHYLDSAEADLKFLRGVAGARSPRKSADNKAAKPK